MDEKYAENFISLLTSLSNIVLFSAAIPLQGGTHHVNEQVPQYWADIFKSHGFDCYDILREKIRRNEEINLCYRQNTLIFAHESERPRFEKLGFSPETEVAFLVLLPWYGEVVKGMAWELGILRPFHDRVINHPLLRVRRFLKKLF